MIVIIFRMINNDSISQVNGNDDDDLPEVDTGDADEDDNTSQAARYDDLLLNDLVIQEQICF